MKDAETAVAVDVEADGSVDIPKKGAGSVQVSFSTTSWGTITEGCIALIVEDQTASADPLHCSVGVASSVATLTVERELSVISKQAKIRVLFRVKNIQTACKYNKHI